LLITSLLILVVSFDQLAVDEGCTGPDERDEVGAFTMRQRCWADSMSLNAIATPAARFPGPLVTR
jgi:hypothetical protein